MYTYRIAGIFRGVIFSWFSWSRGEPRNICTRKSANRVTYRVRAPKTTKFFPRNSQNYDFHENITPRKIPAIWYSITTIPYLNLHSSKGKGLVHQTTESAVDLLEWYMASVGWVQSLNEVVEMSVQHTDLHVLYFSTCTCTKGPEGVYRLQCMSWGLRGCPSYELQYYQLGHTAHDDRASTHSDYASWLNEVVGISRATHGHRKLIMTEGMQLRQYSKFVQSIMFCSEQQKISTKLL